MNDIRRTVLWVIFGFSMVLLWDKWQIYNGRAATFFPTPPVATKPADAASAVPSGVPTAVAPQIGGVASAPVALAPGAAIAASAPTAPVQPAERVEFSTDVLKLVFSTEGGTLVRTEFPRHVDMQDKKRNVVLLDDRADHVYVAQSGLIGAAGVGLPTHKTVLRLVPGERTLKDGSNELVVKFESPDVGGLKLVKTWTFKRGAYLAEVRHEVLNSSGTPQSPQLYLQLMRDASKPPGESSFYSTFTGPAVYTSAKKYQKVEFEEISKNKVDIEKQANDGFVAMAQHYFASAWLLADGVARELFVRKVDANLYSVGMITPVPAIAPGGSHVVNARFYAGPQEEKQLEAIYPGLELVKDYGYFTLLAKPLYWLLDALHGFIQNWGWAIVALVVLLKIAFYWLNAKAFESMAKMKAITPKITELRERLKDKPQQMQQEMMRVYREEKVNPMGGCLPIMIQIPVFIALYWVLLSSVEMRNAPWALWIHDLSAPDPWYILPTIMTLTQLIQTALNPLPPDPMQAKMMWFMPLAFGVMFFFFPSGLVLYYIANNLLTIAQQGIINKRMGVPMQFNLPKF